VRDVCTQVDRQREIEVMRTDSITEFLRALQLLFLEPFFKEVLAVLKKDRSREFEGLVTVQGALIKENPKILKNRGELTGLHGDMLESLNCIGCSKNPLHQSDLKCARNALLLESWLRLWLPLGNSQRQTTDGIASSTNHQHRGDWHDWRVLRLKLCC